MPKNTTINLRVNSDIKENVGEILESMGLTFSEAYNLMLHQVMIKKALPFEIVSYGYTPKSETIALIERIENGEEELIGPFDTFEEFMSSLERDGDEI